MDTLFLIQYFLHTKHEGGKDTPLGIRLQR